MWDAIKFYIYSFIKLADFYTLFFTSFTFIWAVMLMWIMFSAGHDLLVWMICMYSILAISYGFILGSSYGEFMARLDHAVHAYIDKILTQKQPDIEAAE